MIRLKVFESGFRRRRYSQREGHSDHISASHQYSKPCGPKQYRHLVLRIALYPLTSLTTFGVISIANMYLFFGGIHNASNLRLFSASRLVYLSRGSIYALVAAVDPAFSRAFKALYRHYLRRSVPSRSTNSVGFAATSEGLHSAGSLGMLAPRTEETELREIDPRPKHGNTFGPSSALEVSREFPLPKPEPAVSASSRRARYEYPPDRSYVIPEESFGRSLEESRGYRSYCSHHSYHSDLEKSL
ncbi:hypothetical protein PM082_021663 [Marasmius tenuissimus]|nr:hypothetical protein PM082_021663 [Marasmius tenuissimus]